MAEFLRISEALRRIHKVELETAVAILADEARRTAGQSRLPIDAIRIAQAHGLTIEEQVIRPDGYLADWPGAHCRIVLRALPERTSAALMRRRRFTLAHEIGHFVVREALRGVIPASAFKSGNPEEERLCNQFAAELLMPTTPLISRLRQVGVTAGSALKLARLCDVSLKAFLCRMRQILDPDGWSRKDQWRCFGAIWTRRGTYCAAEWSTPTAFRGMILCDSGKTSVEKAFRFKRTEERGSDSIILDGKVTRWRCTSIQLAGSMVLTVGFRPVKGQDSWLGVSRERHPANFPVGSPHLAQTVATEGQLALWN